MSKVKNKVEAILFLAGKSLEFEDIKKLCRTAPEDVQQALGELKKEYDEKNSSVTLVQEGTARKFTVKEEHMSLARELVRETELSKSVLETLAVIAFKYPIKQSDIIKIRTNKAYSHLVELEQSGFITRQKHSRTNLIKLTEKFFEYFDLSPEKLKDKFRDFSSIAHAIKEKETKIEEIKAEQKQMAEEQNQMDDKIKKEIEELDKEDEDFEVPVQVYEAEKRVEEDKGEKLGELEVVEEKHELNNDSNENAETAESEIGKEGEENKKNDAEDKEKSKEEAKDEPVSPEVQQEIDKMLHPKDEEQK